MKHQRNNSGNFGKPNKAENKSYKKSDKTKTYGKKYDKASKYSDIPEYKKAKINDKPKKDSYGVRKNKIKVDRGAFAEEKHIQSKKTKASEKPNKDTQEGIRLNKYISNSGMCSRREADKYISTGVVTINDKVVTELGVRVMPGDDVKFGGEKINPERKVYILLNKPKDYVTTLDDPEGRKTVMDLIKGACNERVYPVGRLDRNTMGLLLLTNDGELTKKLTHPKYNKKKIYHVVLDKPLSVEHLEQIAEGIELEDGFISADKIDYVVNTLNEIGIELHSGRNRIVRRIFEHFGYAIKKLDRVYFAGLTKLNLPRGKWRYLSEKEVIKLKTGMYE
jgi:23S rRNA pseudouridine2605 synthase